MFKGTRRLVEETYVCEAPALKHHVVQANSDSSSKLFSIHDSDASFYLRGVLPKDIVIVRPSHLLQEE